MKIFIIPIEDKFKPKKQRFKYPAHNSDYGVEQDFYEYMVSNKNVITNPLEADWHYLPIFWTRWHLNHNYGKEGLDELQTEVNTKIIDSNKTFTICQYDDGPIVNLGKAVQFLASRNSQTGIDIPLLSSPHHLPFFEQTKKHRASFMGRIKNHRLREEMAQELKDNNDILIKDGNFGSRFFVKNTLKSYIALCPRGYGGSSFRLFEAMQLGVVPLLLGDIDTRPFKDFVDWDKISFYTDDATKLKAIINSHNSEKLIEMGRMAKVTYTDYLQYQRWCPYVLKELEQIKDER